MMAGHLAEGVELHALCVQAIQAHGLCLQRCLGDGHHSLPNPANKTWATKSVENKHAAREQAGEHQHGASGHARAVCSDPEIRCN